MREYTEGFFVDAFGEEMKIDIYLPSMNRYPPELNHLSTLDDFFAVSYGTRNLHFTARIFLPSFDEALKSDMREAAERFRAETRGNAPNVVGSVRVYSINDPWGFYQIDTSIDDEVRFNRHRASPLRSLPFQPLSWSEHFYRSHRNREFSARFTEVYPNFTR